MQEDVNLATLLSSQKDFHAVMICTPRSNKPFVFTSLLRGFFYIKSHGLLSPWQILFISYCLNTSSTLNSLNPNIYI